MSRGERTRWHHRGVGLQAFSRGLSGATSSAEEVHSPTFTRWTPNGVKGIDSSFRCRCGRCDSTAAFDAARDGASGTDTFVPPTWTPARSMHIGAYPERSRTPANACERLRTPALGTAGVYAGPNPGASSQELRGVGSTAVKSGRRPFLCCDSGDRQVAIHIPVGQCTPLRLT